MLSQRLVLVLGVMALLLGAWSCTRIEEGVKTSPQGVRLGLVYTSNLDGEIDPCG